jgi:hypothetical protein
MFGRNIRVELCTGNREGLDVPASRSTIDPPLSERHERGWRSTCEANYRHSKSHRRMAHPQTTGGGAFMSFGWPQRSKELPLRRLHSACLIRAFIVGLYVFGYIALSPVVSAHAQTTTRSDSIQSDLPIQIDQIDPNPARAGADVVIRFKQPIPSALALKVMFDDIKGEVIGSSEYAVRVRVPSDFKAGNKPWVIVQGLNFSSPPYRDFQILSSSIASVEPSVVARNELTPVRNWVTAAAAAVSSLFVAGVAALLLFFMRRIRVREKRADERAKALEAFRAKLAAAHDAKGERPTRLNETPPAVPEALVSACGAGECVLFAGVGLEAALDTSTTVELLAQLIEVAQKDVPPDDWDSLPAALLEGETERLKDMLRASLGRAKLRAWISDHTDLPTGKLNDVATTLSLVPFAGAITLS